MTDLRPFAWRIGVIVGLALPSSALAQLACLPIDRIDVHNVASVPNTRIDAITAPFEGQCIGLEVLDQILAGITEAYVDAGLITSRAYLPEQDLSDGQLEIAVVEGVIEDIRFNDEIDRRWQRVVYPKLAGEIADIREIEQGLDVIRNMESYSADMRLDPGEEVGGTILNIQATTEKPWRFKYSANNYSQEPMGEWSSTVALEADHVMGLNDQWSVSYTKSMSPTPLNYNYDGFGTEAVAASLTLPYGLWEGTLSFNASQYHQEIDGTFTPIPLDGWSQSWNLDVKRLLHRDQVSKTYLTGSLGRSENKNFILGTLIESSSRVISTAKIDLSHERPFYGGNFKGNLSYEKGIKAFNSERADKQPDGQPDAQFSRWLLAGTYERDWSLASGALGYNATFSSQYSDDRLYGGQQFSLGGVSTVRGVWSPIATGNKGYFLRQELEWKPAHFNFEKLGQIAVYAGLDHGGIFKDSRYDIQKWYATSAVLGVRLVDGVFDLDVSYGKLLNLGDQSGLNKAQPSGELMVSLSFEF